MVGQPAARIEHEGRAVEDLIVLPAHEVQVGQRQPGLDGARDHERIANVLLAAEIGRAVRHQQDLRSGLRQRLGHVVEPRVLADRRADADRPDRVGAGDVARREVALLVEHLVVRAVVLVDLRHDRAVMGHDVAVERLLLARGPMRDPDAEGGAVGAVGDQSVQDRARMGHEGGFPHQILRLVTGQEHFRQRDHVRARVPARFPRLPRLRGVAVEIAHHAIELRQREAEGSGHLGLRACAVRGRA